MRIHFNVMILVTVTEPYELQSPSNWLLERQIQVILELNINGDKPHVRFFEATLLTSCCFPTTEVQRACPHTGRARQDVHVWMPSQSALSRHSFASSLLTYL
jgi:hypothetical protein